MGTDTSGAPLGILAGGGPMPRRLAEAAKCAGRRIFLVAYQGQTDPAAVAGLPHAWVKLGVFADTLSELKRAAVVDVIMVGQIRRPSLSELGLDWRGAQFFARLGLRALGDDGLLSALVHEFEAEGFRLIGAQDVLPDSLVPLGVLGRIAPDDQARADIARGIEVARALGSADVGQAVVVQQGLVLGVEAIEGTDALLRRVAELRRAGPGGVLVKIAKPQQDRRLDLPTIGPVTVAEAAAAGLRGIAAEADGAFMVDQAACIEAADAAGLFLLGLGPEEVGAA